MFEESLLESAHLPRTQSRWPAFASVAIQATIAAIIVVIPLLRPAALTLATANFVLTPPAPIPPKPPQVQRVHTDISTASIAVPTVQMMTHEQGIIRNISPTGTSEAEPSTGDFKGMSSADPNALLASTTTPFPHVVIAAHPSRVNVSQGVSVGLLLAPIQPIYPVIAKSTHTEGTVVIHAIISKEGRIESASVVSGPALLQAAALDAVRAAHYHPYKLNGEPTEVETTFSINFRMNS